MHVILLLKSKIHSNSHQFFLHIDKKITILFLNKNNQQPQNDHVAIVKPVAQFDFIGQPGIYRTQQNLL